MGQMKRWKMGQRYSKGSLAIATLLGTVASTFIGAIAAQAVRLSDGIVYFEGVPRLINATVSRQSVADSNPKYYFELSVPADAGESLQTIEITQQNRHTFTGEVEFKQENVHAFQGRRRDRGSDLTVSSLQFDEETHTATATFDPPIAPGTDFTLQLTAKRNPRQSGVYLFGVTAYPTGDNAHGQFLGFGRFHIYDNNLFP